MRVHILIFACALAATSCSMVEQHLDSQKHSAEKMGAVAAIKSIHQAQVQYYSQYNKYASTLAELGTPAPSGPYSFVLKSTPKSYTINANVPEGWTLFSDDSMVIRQHKAPEPADATDPEVGSPQ